MVKLIWTDQAINDLSDIGDYIAVNSETYAELRRFGQCCGQIFRHSG